MEEKDSLEWMRVTNSRARLQAFETRVRELLHSQRNEAVEDMLTRGSTTDKALLVKLCEDVLLPRLYRLDKNLQCKLNKIKLKDEGKL
jgi:hypothetical protein